MSPPPATYIPINCEFHDLLESLATTHKPAQIGFRDADGAEQQRTAAITDVYAHDGAEFLSLSTGETLRLDQLLSVDGQNLADYNTP